MSVDARQVGEPSWLVRARDAIGLKEIKGTQHEPEVLAMARDAHLGWIRDDETAWCAVFVCAMLERSRIVSPRNAAARSFQHWGTNMLDDGVVRIPLGAIVVFDRPPNPYQGHVGFAVGFTANSDIVTLGGNQNDSVSITTISHKRLIAARWPIEYAGDLRLLHTIPLISNTGALSTNEA